MARRSRLQKQISDSVRAVNYIAHCEQRGQDVSRLEEMRDKRTAFLLRERRCLHCGTPIERDDSLEDWRKDGLGPVCRQNLGAAAPRYRMTWDESPESLRDDEFDRRAS